ncbi:XrtA/PEP-CTERM system TPR-repeat protein PrsT [Thalassotalea maritima]|uniref:XrtA/PEP-CTERM system TPR-repeat protein PrsT n=1 Tax=Thalassotalea maritima TaxID=3242416 RepID=UPI003527E08D
MLTVFWLALVGCQQAKSPEQHYQSAISAYQEKDYQTAIVELKSSLQSNVDDYKARLLLGKSYLISGNPMAAEKELRKSIQTGADINDVSPYLARALLMTRDYAAIDDVINDQAIATDIMMTIKTLVAIDYIFNRRIEQGQQLIADVLNEGDSELLYFQLGKVLIAALDEQLPQAISQTTNLLKYDNQFNDVTLLLGRLQLLNNDVEAGIDSLTSYLAAHPYSSQTQLNLAKAHISQGQLKQASALLEPLLAKFPENIEVNQLLSEIMFRQEAYQDAANYAGTALAGNPDLVRSNLIAGVSYYQLQRPESAYHHLKSAEAYLPADHPARKILMQLQFTLGYIEDGVAALDKDIDLSNLDPTILSTASYALLRDGNKEQATRYIEQMSSIDTDSAELLSKRGALKLAINDPSGIDDLERALEKDPQFNEARLILLQRYLQSNDIDGAMSIATRWVEDQPNQAAAYVAKGLVYRRMSDDTNAKNSFKKALTFDPESLSAHYHLAIYDVVEQAYDSAFQRTELLLSINPKHQGGLNILLALSQQSEYQQKSLVQLQSLQQANPDSLGILLTLAKAYQISGKTAEAKALFTFNESEWASNTTFLDSYAHLSINTGDYVKAEELFKRVLTLSDSNYSAYVGLIASYEARRDFTQAIRTVDKALTIFPDDTRLKAYAAYLHLDAGNTEQAELIINEIDKEISEQLSWTLKARLHATKRDFNNAKAYAQNLYQETASEEHTELYTLVLRGLSEHNEAIDILSKAIEQYPDNKKLKLLLAELTMNKEPSTAFKIYQELVSKMPDNVLIHNNMAWTAINLEKYDVALENAQKAADISNNAPEVLDTLGLAYMRRGDYQLAESHFIKAMEALPDHPGIILHYAELLIYLNRPDESRQVIAKLDSSEKKQRIEAMLEDSPK